MPAKAYKEGDTSHHDLEGCLSLPALALAETGVLLLSEAPCFSRQESEKAICISLNAMELFCFFSLGA